MTKLFSAALLGAGLLLAMPASAAVRIASSLAAAPVERAAAQAEIDRYRVSCRRKVRRWLGPSKGRHTGMMRIAYTEQCAMNGGRLT